MMYLAPEVLSGQPPKATADVYSLGVMLYQTVVGDFRRPLAPGWEAAVDDPLLREDIADAACGDPARRLKTAAELAERLTNLNSRRAEREQQSQAEKRRQLAERKRARVRARIPWVLLAAVLVLAAGFTFVAVRKKTGNLLVALPGEQLHGNGSQRSRFCAKAESPVLTDF